jgi:hypothetical protein
MGQTGLRVSTCLITRRGYDSAVAERLCSVRDEPTWARDRRFLASVSAGTSFVRSPAFDPGRALRLRIGLASEFRSLPTGTDALAMAAEVPCATALRPSPRAFANVERRSE